MTQLAPPATPLTLSQGANTWDRAAITTLGAAGCALSYDALQQMAGAIHVRGLLTYLFPLVIDGFIAYGVRALILLRTAPFRARLYIWALFSAATAASIWANALHAVRLNQQPPDSSLRLGDATVGILSTLAPLALAGAVHLHILITRQTHQTEPSAPVEPPEQPPAPAPATYVHPQLPLPGTQHDLNGEGACPDVPGSRTTRYGRPPGADMDDLLALAHKSTAPQGKATRATVRNAVRDAGLTISEDRLTELMHHLRTAHPATTGPPRD